MEKITQERYEVLLKQCISETFDAKLFLDFISANGFNEENYSKILELVQSVPNCLSKYLNNDKQFLLSRKVVYSELENYRLNGALGHLDSYSQIVVPKTLEADRYFNFFGTNSSQGKYGYGLPNIHDFDTGIVFSDEFNRDNVSEIIKLSCDENFDNIFVGFVGSKDDNTLKVKEQALIRLSEMFYCEFIHDTDSLKGKEFYLMKRK